jgi:hypothetical protein
MSPHLCVSCWSLRCPGIMVGAFQGMSSRGGGSLGLWGLAPMHGDIGTSSDDIWSCGEVKEH